MKLPDQEDFYRSSMDLDGQSAWKNFGGLDINQAYEKFCQRPDIYQEDFMFMRDPAFAFYFPVVDKYIREKEFLIAFSGETRILCAGMTIRFEQRFVRKIEFTQETNKQIISLCRFILDNLNTPSVLKTSEDMKKEFGEEFWYAHTSLAAIKNVCTILLVEAERASS